MGLPPTADALPDALVDRDQWVCWRSQQREDKHTKVPNIPGTTQFASTTDPDTWRDFQTARKAVTSTPVDGLGFVFTADDPLIGIDLDDCRNRETGDPTTWASQIITQLDSYTEVSPSETGYHILITGSLPEGRNRAGNLELYDRSRFFTVTGTQLAETPATVAERTAAVASIHAEKVAPESSSEPPSTTTDRSPSDDTTAPETATAGAGALSDDELLTRAHDAANGAKFSRLWGGDTSGYESHSEADMALCRLLAFWTGRDRSRMDRLFRQSGLARDKWDEVHYADGSTYGEKTLERAIARTDDVYTPPETADASPSAGDTDTALDDSSTSPTTTASDATQHTSTPSAESTSPSPAEASSSDDSTAGPHSPTATAPNSLPASHPQRAQARLERLEELTGRIEALIEENEQLRADLATERNRRQALERATNEDETASWWPL
jgi:primase-polymerase (primpol)-like protein